jgi:molybdenum cofactor cytidylyltransferase
MHLSTALRLQAGDVVAFVGAGGKTSSLRRIVSELSEKMLVIATTTTKLAKHESSIAPNHHVIQNSHDLDEALASLPSTGAWLFTGPLLTQAEKWTAPDPADHDRIIRFARGQGGIVLVEADGARGAMVKAPAAHEPVIPAGTTIVVPLLRIDAIGQRPVEGQVHRPERMAELLGIGLDDPLTINHLADLMSHELGGMKGIPASAVVRVFINAVASVEQIASARSLARLLGNKNRIRSVILGSPMAQEPALEVWGRTGVVVLAAGGSERFGSPKLLQPWQDTTILRQVVRMVLRSGIQPAVVVLGASFNDLEHSLADLPIARLENPAWSTGQSSSLKVGLRAIQDQCEALIFVLGDMPEVDATLLESLVETHRRSLHPIIAPFAGGRWGNPVLFDQTTFDDLLSIEGDRGGRALFERYPPLPIPADTTVLFDIDKPDDIISAH